MRRRTAIVTALVIAMAPLGVTTAAAASTPPRAEPKWSMVPLAKDVNGDDVIDGDGGVPRRGALSSQPSARRVGAGNRVAQPNERLIDGRLSWYLPTDGFPVLLDACASKGDDFRWSVADATGRVVRTTPWTSLSDCRTTIRLPEASYALTLEARRGSRVDTSTLTAQVRNLLVLALGDSYASGEGNPRNVMAWLRNGGALSPYWDDDACHRSARGGPAKAALALERASSQTSVTLLDLACSGATVDAGILGPQTSAGQAAGQIEQAVAVLGERQVDLVTLSIGGNDVGFTSILQACATNVDCPLARPPAGPLAGARTVQAGVQAQTAALADDFTRIAACLGGTACVLSDGRPSPGVRLAANARVLPTLYPDITRAADGSSCAYLTISAQDFAWARDTVLVPTPANPYAYQRAGGATVPLPTTSGSLNGQVAATSRLGWSPVAGAWSASGEAPDGHGVCAGGQAWVFGLTAFSALPGASFHPNPTGQQVISDAIVGAVGTSS